MWNAEELGHLLPGQHLLRHTRQEVGVLLEGPVRVREWDLLDAGERHLSARVCHLLTTAIAMLGAAVAWAAFTGGGDDRVNSSIVLLIVGVAGLIAMPAIARQPSRPRDRLLTGAALLLPAYVAFQLVPLPVSLLQMLSPARADLANAVLHAMPEAGSAPITVSAPTTWTALWRTAGCAIVFLLVRAITGTPQRQWRVVMPLVVVGVCVAAAALLAGPSHGGYTAGAYANRNHFANLNLMILPLAIGAAVAALHRMRHKGAAQVIVAAACLIGAALLLVAVLFAWSKGATLTLVVALAVMAGMVARGRFSVPARILVAASALLLLVAFVALLSPAGLVQRFAALASGDPTEGRVAVWGDTLRLIRAYPVAGVGLGSFYPAVLPFQSYGLDLAWVHAHNDYLQAIAELGLLGALIPACLIGVALWSALRSAHVATARETRLLAIGCACALIAFFVHSVAEFNGYVLSNALAVSWVAGAATGLASPVWASSGDGGGRSSRPVAAAVLVLGSFSAATAAGWLTFVQSYEDDPRAERALCRYGICDSSAAIATLQAGPEPGVVYPVPPDDMAVYVRRDPAAPERWEDYGEALRTVGRVDEARYAFDQAVRLAPRTPSTLLMAADFHFDIGETDPALDLVSRGLSEGAGLDRAAFAVMAFRHVPIGDRLRALPDARAARAHFEWLLQHSENPSDLLVAWDALLVSDQSTPALAARFVDYMVAVREPSSAAQGWSSYLTRQGEGYTDGDAIFNGGFEHDPCGSRFDWRFTRVDGLSARVDERVKVDGARSLRLTFDGTRNVTDLGVQQNVYVPAGRYRLTALARADQVTTDQGVRIRVTAEFDGGLQVATDDVRDTTGWRPLEVEIAVPDGGSLLRVAIARERSLKFDSSIGGTVWVDSVKLTKLE